MDVFEVLRLDQSAPGEAPPVDKDEPAEPKKGEEALEGTSADEVRLTCTLASSSPLFSTARRSGAVKRGRSTSCISTLTFLLPFPPSPTFSPLPLTYPSQLTDPHPHPRNLRLPSPNGRSDRRPRSQDRLPLEHRFSTRACWNGGWSSSSSKGCSSCAGWWWKHVRLPLSLERRNRAVLTKKELDENSPEQRLTSLDQQLSDLVVMVSTLRSEEAARAREGESLTHLLQLQERMMEEVKSVGRKVEGATVRFLVYFLSSALSPFAVYLPLPRTEARANKDASEEQRTSR
jgi:hypothetical protein